MSPTATTKKPSLSIKVTTEAPGPSSPKTKGYSPSPTKSRYPPEISSSSSRPNGYGRYEDDSGPSRLPHHHNNHHLSTSPSHSPVRSRRPRSPLNINDDEDSSIASTLLLQPLAKLNQLKDSLPPPPEILKKKVPHSVSSFFAPRVIGPVAGWLLAIYAIHQFLLPLPFLTFESVIPPRITSNEEPGALGKVFVPPREGDDNLDSVDSRWRPLSLIKPPDGPYPTLQHTRFLPERCMEQFFLEGVTDCPAEEIGPEEKLDATWFWVNGTDPRWMEGQKHWKEQAGIDSPAKHFRENNELVYSIRSVLASLPGKIRNAHIISADYPFRVPEDLHLIQDSLLPSLESIAKTSPSFGLPQRGKSKHVPRYNATTRDGTPISDQLAHYLSTTWRVAQTPTWLDFSKRDPSSPVHPFSHPSRRSRIDKRGPLSDMELNYPTLRYAVHSEIFHVPTSGKNGMSPPLSLGEAEWKDERFREQALPTFNSMAIESRVGWLPGVSDIMLTLNDDFFMMRRHSVADFYTPFYGPVLRLDANFGNQVPPKLDPKLFTEAGENGGLFHANWLLSQRFPKRLRQYTSHVPKVISREMHHEVSLVFREALTMSGTRKFREQPIGEGDVQTLWLTMHWRVERWREALLWSFSVAGLGTMGEWGMWGRDAREHLEAIFGLKQEGDEDVIEIEVNRGERLTLRDWRMESHLDKAGFERPAATQMIFSSMDGHLPKLIKPGYPNTNNKCTLKLDQCFGSFWTEKRSVPAVDMFKRFAFEEEECGDCLISALVTASGPLGLSAFFPHRATYQLPARGGKIDPANIKSAPPHLPLTPTWQEADFKLESVLANSARAGEEVDLTLWCMKLLSRYQYISGRSNVRFHQLYNEGNAKGTFRTIDASRGTSFLGLNDDIEWDYDKVKVLMTEWFEKKWPQKAVWERGWDRQVDWDENNVREFEEFVAW